MIMEGDGDLEIRKRKSSNSAASNFYLQQLLDMLLSCLLGDVAQLGERDNRTVEVRGSSPLISTKLQIANAYDIVSFTIMGDYQH
jgi:hypothetical protein